MRGDSHSSGSGDAFRTLPINLLLKDRLCLLVGAGHVAHRKLVNLLDHGARVVLVAPEIDPEVRALEEDPDVRIRIGRYDPTLLDEFEPFLVYAATDDDTLNVRIAADAADRGLLSSSASSWRAGDFISPSVLRWGRGQVSITTEGASCRQAKFMRLRLEDLLGGDRELVVIGVDVRTLGFETFEAVRPDVERRERVEAMLRHLASLEEFALLVTCNRMELYAWSRMDDSLRGAVRSVMGLDAVADHVYVRRGEEVLTHAADVVAGHLSEVVCETQITAQFKEAFRRAFAANVAGVHLQNLHDRALRLAKRVRAMQGVDRDGLRSLVKDRIPEGSRVLLLGAGHLATEMADSLPTPPDRANRTVERLPAGGMSLSDAVSRLDYWDVVVCAVGCGHPVVRVEHVAGLPTPPLLIDLGLPRNVDPAVREHATVLTLEDFKTPDEDRERLSSLTRSVAEVLHG
ncbi:MAG: NAD(P)-dependent oxidoreductase [Planctomycetota bacterium]